MKALLITVVLLSVSLVSFAQPSAPIAQGPVRTEEYCQLKTFQKFNGKINISIDYGQQQKLIALNLFRDATGRAIEFNSVVDALNWLNTQGWEFVNAYAMVNDGDSCTYYVMRRRLTS